jgi:hypothetical protein
MTPDYESKFNDLFNDVKRELVKLKRLDKSNAESGYTALICDQADLLYNASFDKDLSAQTKEGIKLMAMIARFMIETL